MFNKVTNIDVKNAGLALFASIKLKGGQKIVYKCTAYYIAKPKAIALLRY